MKADHSAILKHVLLGFLIAALLIAIKLYIESNTEVGYRLQLLTYEFLVRRLSSFSADTRLPVLVVDISRLPGGTLEQVTPRDKLQELIDEIANHHPIAIGVDIDFSPGEKGWLTEKDPQFFDFCHKIGQEKHVPVFLGVDRAAKESSEVWLVLEKYKDLAASIDILQEGRTRNTTRMPRYILADDIPIPDRLPTMSFALARAYQAYQEKPGHDREPKAPRLLEWALEAPSDQEHEEHFPLVNYSKLEQLQHETIPATSATTVSDLRNFFPRNIVIVGDATKAMDQFDPPGRGSTAGVYAHASAAYTFAIEPLFEFNYVIRLIVDFAISMVIILGVARKRYSNIGKAHTSDTDRWQAKFIKWVVIGVILLGIFLVRAMHMMWLDFVLVLFALLLHPSVEHWLGRFWIKR